MDTPEQRETLTSDDLDRIFIRAVDEHGKWDTVNTWAKSRMPIQGEDEPWSLEERADFCNTLWQAGALSILKKDVELEEE